MLLRSPASASRHLWSLRGPRGFSSSSPSAATAAAEGGDGKIVASVLFERLPVVIPKIHPVVYAFQEFSFRWRQQYRRQYPDDVLGKADARGKGDYQIDYVPAPRITEADKTNDRKLKHPCTWSVESITHSSLSRSGTQEDVQTAPQLREYFRGVTFW